MHNLTSDCLHSFIYEIYRDSYEPFASNDWVYISQSRLDNARAIFDDSIMISFMLENIRVAEGSLLETILKFLEVQVYPKEGYDMQQITGINYRQLGFYVGDFLGYTTIDFNKF